MTNYSKPRVTAKYGESYYHKNPNHFAKFAHLAHKKSLSGFWKYINYLFVMNTREFYHGTVVGAVSPISKDGIAVSSKGRLGPGVYLTTDESVAKKISLHRNGDAAVVFKVRPRPNCMIRTKRIERSDKAGSWAKQGYDSATSTHPAWANSGPFEEWVVQSPDQIEILELIIVGGTYNGEITLAGKDIRVSGNVTFGGNITAGNLVIG